MAPPASRVPLDDLPFPPRNAVGRVESYFKKANGDWVITSGSGFLAVLKRDLASPRDYSEKLYLVSSAHTVVDHRSGEFKFLLFFPGQKDAEDSMPDRNEGCFEVAVDELSSNRRILVSGLYSSEGLLDQEAAFDATFIELNSLHPNSNLSLTDMKKAALVISLDHPTAVGDTVRWFGFPVAEDQDRKEGESIMFRHKSTLKSQLPPKEGTWPGSLVREGLGRPGDGGSGGPWLIGRNPVGLMAWQLLEDLHSEEAADSYSPYLSSTLVDSIPQNNIVGN